MKFDNLEELKYHKQMNLHRYYDNLDKYISPGKALVILGPRRVGKTTLIDQYLSQTKYRYKLDTGDNIETQQVLGSQDFEKIFKYVQGYELIVIDEAQQIPNIGMGLKIIVDHRPEACVVVTGSSSFDLAGQLGEPLTGRKRTLTLYPVAQLELLGHPYTPYELKREIPERIVFGNYPQIIAANNNDERRALLEEITRSYLFKDILSFERVKNSKLLTDLLRLIAFQIGSEVSLTELGNQLQINYKTVARYLDLFEKSFILYNLRGFSRNLRKEITKKSKYYFYDTGIRNAIIANFNPLEIRNDIGALWENFVISERLKKQEYHSVYANNYFWRTWDQQEVDWVEERDGKAYGYEITWSNKQKKKEPKNWQKAWVDTSYETITQQNYLDFSA